MTLPLASNSRMGLMRKRPMPLGSEIIYGKRTMVAFVTGFNISFRPGGLTDACTCGARRS